MADLMQELVAFVEILVVELAEKQDTVLAEVM